MFQQDIRNRTPFKKGNMYGQSSGDLYVVYSYGDHWPLAFHTPHHGWVVNDTKYDGPTTVRHQTAVNLALCFTNHQRAGTEDMIRTIALYKSGVDAKIPPSKQGDLFTVSS